MGYNSTRFISYRDINVDSIDIYEDAWGIYPEFSDVIDLLGKLKQPVPGKRATKKLIAAIRDKR